MSILDPIPTALVEGSSTGGLPISTAKAVHHVAHLLLAARTLDDVNVFALPEADGKGRFAVRVVGKWAISFVMSGLGPDQLLLEKLAKSCHAEPSRFSRRRRPGKP